MSFLSDAEIVIKALQEYYQESENAEKPVIHQESMDTIISELMCAAYAAQGGLTGEQLHGFVKRYLASTIRLYHPAYIGHQVAIPHYTGALGSLIDGFTNNAMAVYEMGAGASSIEYFIINWLLEKVGWEPSPLPPPMHDTTQQYGGGVLTHGGSLANLTALIAARNRCVPGVWKNGNPANLALLAPASCHYSIARAAGILGIGQHAVYPVAVNSEGMIVADKLPQVYEQLQKEGKCAVALVANACSTAVGIYDPLDEIAAFCQEKNLWLHIDGAHGASALLSPKYAHYLKGIEKADSLTWDAHKLMQTPTLCTALLFRNHHDLDTAFEQEASYLFHEKEQPGFDFLHRTVECTKAGLGLKLFFVLGSLGEQGLARFIESRFELAMHAYDYIRRQKGFRCAVKPQSNILCFRVEGHDDLQMAIREKLLAEGHYYITTTVFNGERFLRLSFMNPQTTIDTVAGLVETISRLRSMV